MSDFNLTPAEEVRLREIAIKMHSDNEYNDWLIKLARTATGIDTPIEEIISGKKS